MLKLRPNESVQGVDMRGQRTQKTGFITHGNQQRGEVVDVQRVQHVSLVFHIHPEKLDPRKPGGDLLKAAAVVAAHPAPVGAQANHQHSRGCNGQERRHGMKMQ